MAKKRGTVVITITIGIVCFILAMTIFIQFKIVYQTDLTSVDTMREEELQTELATWKSRYEDTEQRYNEIEQTINRYKDETETDEDTQIALEEELANLQLLLGTTDVEGEGIEITINENSEATRKVNADDLMLIVNYLKDAGAEAIEINGQRIIDSSYFAYISETFIRINGNRIVSPYVIKAIGDPDYLKSALIGTGGYSETLQALGHEVVIETPRNVTITKYDGEITTRYIEEE